MSLSMYEVTVPTLLRGFEVLTSYLDKGATYATENKIDPAVLLTARLYPDMQPLSAQIQRASDNAKGAITRLTGAPTPGFPDTETTFDELKERIAKTAALLKDLQPSQFDGSDARIVEMRLGGAVRTLRGDTYLLQVLLPNFFFHLTTAHDILRHNGLKIGKLDYFGELHFLDAKAA
ncbi:DUF1993 domain-containing protein [Roseiterribacter gracilis]|uniref:DUF1993 domain-containing protein n=1 Tax=Roseiterribacter gracilis TaxID=2812848 RepID=A0A8S8XAR0_9PROT|nr:hypothetical protein TMPK1_06840 [Rhodospirillales bacterium TMPK1]